MVKGKKITKKMLKEPDEFISLTQRAILFTEGHYKKIVIAGIIIVVIALGVVFFQMSEKKKEAEANQKLSSAIQNYQRVSSPYQEGSPGEVKKALGNFEQISKQYSGTSAGKFSLLYKGNIHLSSGEFEEAITAYQAYLAGIGDEKLYRLFGLEGLAYAHEGKKDYSKALDAFKQITALGETFELDDAYLGLGRCYERLGKNQEALDSYRAFLKTAKKSGMANLVARKVSLLEK
jgi:tetratricopeptide (TPR) repeat protein